MGCHFLLNAPVSIPRMRLAKYQHTIYHLVFDAMHLFMFIFVACLFFILTPGIILSLPPKGSKTIVAATHALVFATVWTLIHKFVWDWGIQNGWISGGRHKMLEGMTLRLCNEAKGTYQDGYCFDSAGNEIRN